MGRIKVLHEGGIVQDNDVSCDVAVDYAALLLLAVGSFRKKSIDLLCDLSGHEISMRCLPLVYKHDTMECSRLLLKRGHGIPASLADTRVIHISMVDGDETKKNLLCKILLPSQAGVAPLRSHYIDCRSLYLRPMAAKFRGMNIKETLLMVDIYVDEADSKEDVELYVWLKHDQRIVWHLLKNNASISQGNINNLTPVYSIAAKSCCKALQNFIVVHNCSVSIVKFLLRFEAVMELHNLRKHVPIHVAPFQAMCFSQNSARMVPWYNISNQKDHVIIKECGYWLRNDDLDGFNGSYTWPKTLAANWHSVFGNYSAQLTTIRSQCVVKQDSMLVAQNHWQKHDYISKTFLGCLPSSVGSECSLNSPKCDFRTLEVSYGMYGYHVLRDTFHFLPGASMMCVVRSGNGPATHRVHLPQLQSELSWDHQFPTSPLTTTESKSELKYLMSPLTTCMTRDISRDTSIPQVDACNESKVNSYLGDKCNMSDTFSQQDGDTIDNDSLLIPIFLRHVSGELVLNVNVDISSQHLMHMYALKTKTKPEFQYFFYNKKRLESDRTLRFHGVQRDTTVHVYSRLLGGVIITLAEYANDNKSKFTVEVTLPTGELSIQLTNLGCQFLSSWINCFTTAFSKGLSWNGDFTLNDFKYFDGHIRKIKKPKVHGYGAIGDDLKEFTHHVEEILCSQNENLISKYPPYLEYYINFLNHLVIRDVCLPGETKLYLDTALCCTTSFARERLIIELYREYEGLDQEERTKWDDAINNSHCSDTWYTEVSQIAFFKEFIDEAIKESIHYPETKIGAFRFLRDVVMHSADYRKGKAKKGYDDGQELMIPTFFKDFLPDIIKNLILKNIDIRAELEAAIQCACTICDS